jgi:hypothetical protein
MLVHPKKRFPIHSTANPSRWLFSVLPRRRSAMPALDVMSNAEEAKEAKQTPEAS